MKRKFENGTKVYRLNLSLTLSEMELLAWAFENDTSKMALYLKERISKVLQGE